jgi:hypothetical protein
MRVQRMAALATLCEALRAVAIVPVREYCGVYFPFWSRACEVLHIRL